MPRGICWDDLPDRFYGATTREPSRQSFVEKPLLLPETSTAPQERDIVKDAQDVGRRVLFGVVAGGLTGACFGLVDVFRDPKMLATKREEGTKKIVRFTTRFAVFFGTYHGLRKVLRLTVPMEAELNLGIAGAVTLAPLAAMPALRPMFPYAAMMVILDAFNGLNDV